MKPKCLHQDNDPDVMTRDDTDLFHSPWGSHFGVLLSHRADSRLLVKDASGEVPERCPDVLDHTTGTCVDGLVDSMTTITLRLLQNLHNTSNTIWPRLKLTND